MRLDLLIDHLLDSIGRERLLLRRAARYLLPLLLLPIGFALAQIARGWLGAIVGGLGAAVLLAQIELFLRPILDRARMIDRDIGIYLQLAPTREQPNPAASAPLLWPAAVAVAASMALFLPTILSTAAAWQRLLALALGLGTILMLWQRLTQVAGLLDRVEARLSAARRQLPVAEPSEQLTTNNEQRTTNHGLLDPALSQRMAGLPLPLLALSPAAKALLRVEAYLLLRDLPDLAERDLLDALGALARQAHHDEQRHMLMPPIGGKLY